MIEIDRTKCILCGVCEAIAPTVFAQTGTGVTVDPGEAAMRTTETALAIEACPMACINVK